MRNRYSISEFISTIYAFILTKIFFHGARLVRRPIYLRGRKNIKYGSGLTLGHGCRFDLCGNNVSLFIGENCEFGDYTHIVAYENVEIGKNVLVASKVFISDTNHGIYNGHNQSSPDEAPNDRKLVSSSVKIGDNVWIGENVVILAGCRIGNGCIIGANAVLIGMYEDNSIIVGAPGKIIKKWNPSSQTWETVN